jgi:hypothetical protein
LSHDPWVGVNVKVERPIGCAASQFVVSRETWAEWLFHCNIGWLLTQSESMLLTNVTIWSYLVTVIWTDAKHGVIR